MMALHHDVATIGRSFRVVGMSTPATIARKAELVLTPARPGEHVVIATADAVRCSTTIAALLAAGALGVVVHEKSGRGVSADDANRVAAVLGGPLVHAGELHGRPVEGGVTGNSPREAATANVCGKVVRFASTNFGAAFAEVCVWARRFHAAGGESTIVVPTFLSVPAVARFLNTVAFDRIGVAVAGFYDVITLEDVILAGDLIRRLPFNDESLDDEARVMAAVSSATAGDIRLRLMRTNWIGRALARFGMAADLAAVLSGDGIVSAVRERMETAILMVQSIDDIPVIRAMSAAEAIAQLGGTDASTNAYTA